MATKATLINAAGNKVVVDSGSAQANSYFAQGYKLMGAPASPAPAPAPAPANTNVAASAGKPLPAATTAPTAVATAVNTLKAYDQSGKEVYVQPGTYNPGISATKPDLNADINSNQDQNIATKNQETVGTPEKSAAAKALEEIKAETTPTIAKPEAPKLADTYNNLRATYGVTDLESQLTNLQNEEQTIRNTATARKDYAESKPVALGVIGGRQSEVDRQANLQLTQNLQQQAYISGMLKTKYDIISNLMNFTQKDYENASTAYNNEFNRNITLLQQVRSDETQATNEANIKADNARADYAVFINAIKDGSIDTANLTPAQKSILNKLEVQQGLPVGTYEMLVPKTAGKTLTSLGVDNNTSGGRSAYFMTVDKKTGVPSVISVALPGAVATKGTGSGTTTDEEKQIDSFRKDASDLIGQMDTGKVSWGTAWAQLHVKYPEASSALIDQTLGGGYDEAQGGWYGRAKTAATARSL